MPETATRRDSAWASLRPHHRAAAGRKTLLGVTPANVAVWMLGGFYLSLMPSLIVSATQARSPWLGGFAVTALTLSGALAIALVALRRVGTFRTLLSGEIALASGLLLILIAANAGYPALLLAGSIVAGLGFGATFLGAVRTVLPLEPHERAGLMGAFYVESYLANSVPTMIAGYMAQRAGLLAAADAYGAIILALAVAAIVLAVTRRRACCGRRLPTSRCESLTRAAPAPRCGRQSQQRSRLIIAGPAAALAGCASAATTASFRARPTRHEPAFRHARRHPARHTPALSEHGPARPAPSRSPIRTAPSHGWRAPSNRCRPPTLLPKRPMAQCATRSSTRWPRSSTEPATRCRRPRVPGRAAGIPPPVVREYLELRRRNRRPAPAAHRHQHRRASGQAAAPAPGADANPWRGCTPRFLQDRGSRRRRPRKRC